MQVLIEKQAISPAMAHAVWATWPKDDWRGWHHYSGKDSEKWASKSADIPEAAKHALHEMVRLVGFRVERGCFPDWELYGAGLHMIKPGGYLRPHLDSAMMEATWWKREYSCVLSVNPEWDHDWGGQFRLYDELYIPRFNTLTLFRTTEESVHEVLPVTGPVPRCTLSIFFWSQAKPESERTAAYFLDHRQSKNEKQTDNRQTAAAD